MDKSKEDQNMLGDFQAMSPDEMEEMLDQLKNGQGVASSSKNEAPESDRSPSLKEVLEQQTETPTVSR